MRKILIPAALSALGLLLVWPMQQAEALQCSQRYPEACVSCAETQAAFQSHLNDRPRLRGRAVWTPVYAAYFHDCLDLARRWLEQGQAGSNGGDENDLLATVVIWDRFEYDYRRAWAELLVKHGATLEHAGLDGVTTRERLIRAAAGDHDVARLLADIESWLGQP